MKNLNTKKQRNIRTAVSIVTMVWSFGYTTLCAQSHSHESTSTQPQELPSNRAADPGVGSGHGNSKDLWLINNDSSNHLSQLRFQTSNKAFTFTNRFKRMSLSYETGSNWQNGEGTEIFSIQPDGDTRMSNSYIGSVNDNLDWAGFMHIKLARERSSRESNYAIATTKTGTHTILNKKNTNSGHIGFRVGNVDKMVITNNGNVGVGTSSPSEKLEVAGYGKFQNSANNYLTFGHGGSNSFLDHHGAGSLIFRYEGNNLMTLTQNGQLFIGESQLSSNNDLLNISGGVATDKMVLGQSELSSSTANGSTLLTVSGGVETNKMILGQSELSSSTENGNTLLTVSGGVKTDKVVLNIGSFPDYVFKNDYKLMPIEDVANYVAKNKHLPNVPSEKEMIAAGLDIRMMSLKLVEKVEELTLYTIEQQERLKSQDQLILKLTKRLDQLERKK